MLPYNKNLKQISRCLRRNMTDAERSLWARIRNKQLKNCQFYRQKVIGDYIVDLYCPKARLVIERDGGQHCSDGEKEKDKTRDNYMTGIGSKVLRFSDREVFENPAGILEEIWRHL
jgi:very-short-patch-repair endonuclease